MTDETKQLMSEYELSEREVERAVRGLVYRKVYNTRPEVAAKRRAYNKRRSETVREALRIVRQNPSLLDEVAGKEVA